MDNRPTNWNCFISYTIDKYLIQFIEANYGKGNPLGWKSGKASNTGLRLKVKRIMK